MSHQISVYIALSGGVDSSVAAALLQKKGYICTGVFMKYFDHKINTQNQNIAKNICTLLKIPFKIYDFRKQFKNKVIDYFLSEYKSGKTQNPCVACNKEIKFQLFQKEAFKQGAAFIATGHYARLLYDHQQKAFSLLRAIDKNKDQ